MTATLDREITRKANLFWGRFKSEINHEERGNRSLYRLIGPDTVLDRKEFLNTAQKLALFDIAVECGMPLDCLLGQLYFECDWVELNDWDSYFLPVRLRGTWPHCNLYGMMDEDGRIHT